MVPVVALARDDRSGPSAQSSEGKRSGISATANSDRQTRLRGNSARLSLSGTETVRSAVVMWMKV